MSIATTLTRTRQDIDARGQALAGHRAGLSGLLTQFKDGRRHYYTPLSSPLWAAYEAIGIATGLSTKAPARS